MKKNLIFILIFIFIFSFSCTFNLFEGSVESNYKSIKTPSEKIEYARQILAAGDPEKIKTIIALLEDDIDNNVFSGPDLAAANQIIGNLIIADSGFNDYIANAITEIISSQGGEEEPNLMLAILDSNGDGQVDSSDMDAFGEMMSQLAAAADYINVAATEDQTNVDLQFQNVIANFAAAVVTISDDLSDPQKQQEFQDYLNGTGPEPDFISEIQQNLNNIQSSVQNMLYAPEGTFYYDIAQMLNEMFAGLNP